MSEEPTKPLVEKKEKHSSLKPKTVRDFIAKTSDELIESHKGKKISYVEEKKSELSLTTSEAEERFIKQSFKNKNSSEKVESRKDDGGNWMFLDGEWVFIKPYGDSPSSSSLLSEEASILYKAVEKTSSNNVEMTKKKTREPDVENASEHLIGQKIRDSKTKVKKIFKSLSQGSISSLRRLRKFGSSRSLSKSKELDTEGSSEFSLESLTSGKGSSNIRAPKTEYAAYNKKKTKQKKKIKNIRRTDSKVSLSDSLQNYKLAAYRERSSSDDTGQRASSEDARVRSNSEDPKKGKRRVKFYTSKHELETLELPAEAKRAPQPHIEMLQKPLTQETVIMDPTEIGYYFRRGYRPESLALIGEVCFMEDKKQHIEEGTYLPRTDSVISFSERDPPLEFLLRLGFSADEGTNFVKDSELNGLLQAAIAGARVWVNKISQPQATLLILLACNAKPKIMRYYIRLVEAITNNRITSAMKLDALLRLLEKVEDGQVTLDKIFGDTLLVDEAEETVKKRESRNLFLKVYNMAMEEAAAVGKPTLSRNSIHLLHNLTDKYKPSLLIHLHLLAKLIGQERIKNEVQLEAAMVFLSRLENEEQIKIPEFEKFCGLADKQDGSQDGNLTPDEVD